MLMCCNTFFRGVFRCIIQNNDFGFRQIEFGVCPQCGSYCFIDYKEKSNDIYLIHTESPEELAGKGVATALIEKTLDYIKSSQQQLVPLCPLVFAYIKRHPEWIAIVKEDFKAKFD